MTTKQDDVINKFIKKLTSKTVENVISAIQPSETIGVWILSVAGISLGLIISNLDQIVPYVNIGLFKISLFVLSFSFLFGIVSKILTLNSNTFFRLYRENMKNVLEITDEFTEEINVLKKEDENFQFDKTQFNEKTLNETLEYFPWINHKKIKDIYKKTLNDQSNQPKEKSKMYFWGEFYMKVQLVLFVLFMGIITASLK